MHRTRDRLASALLGGALVALGVALAPLREVVAAYFPKVAIQGAKSAGNYVDAITNPDGSLLFGPAQDVRTPFSRLRTAEPFGLLDAKQILDNGPFVFDTSTTGGGAAVWSANTASTAMTVGTASGDQVIRQSKVYAPYQAGRGQLFYLTGVMGAIKANVTQRIGAFDANNGIFFEQNGSTLGVVRRTSVTGSPVDNRVAQSSWNLDKLDGTGTSGYAIDTTKAQVFVVDYSWLGMGAVRLGVLNGNVLTYCHQFLCSNTLTTVFMSTGSLPVRWEITNTGTAASSTTMTQTCGSVTSEGGFNPPGYVVSATNGTTLRNVTTSLPVLSVRLKSGFNRGIIIPLSVDALTTTANGTATIQVIIGGTLTGASWSNTTGSASEFDVSATAISGGVVKDTFYLAGAATHVAFDTLADQLAATANIAGTTDIVTVVVTVIANAPAMTCSLTWREIY